MATVLATPRSPLTSLPGVGDALAERLEKEFGTSDAFLAAARASEVDRIAAVEGISERRAVELVLAVQGRSPLHFLRTPRAETLYEDILARVSSFANTAHARNRISLLVPVPPAEAKERLAFALDARARVAALDRPAVGKLLARVHRPRQPRPKFDASVCIVVDSDADHEALVKAGVDRCCQVTTAEDGGTGEHEVVVYAYSQGLLDLSGAENVIQVPFSRNVADLVPDAALAYYRENRPLWEAALELARHLGRTSVLRDVLDTLDSLQAREFRFDDVERAVTESVAWMNAEISSRTRTLSLSGDEVLEMMSGRVPRKVRELQRDVLREGRERIQRETGEDLTSVLTDGFPLQVDEEAMDRKRAELEGRRKRAAFRTRVDAARRLAGLREKVEAEIAGLLDFDYAFALGSFALEYGLEPASFGKELRVEGALHLNLARAGGARIEYELTKPHHVALLTGANSGGKTTLLETVAQISILAHLGLPVNARRAIVPPVEGIYFFTQKRSLDAGAFESFLKGFLPIVTSKGTKLVLADELEAMTELEAASRIVGTFIELLRESGSFGVCVTHMAEQVSQHTSVRVDGIEARGLDEEMNLIVDRSPRMNYRARSTPELILRRLQARASGEERRVYDLILKKFA